MHTFHKYLKYILSFIFISFMLISCDKVENNYDIQSPDGQIKVSFYITESGTASYTVFRNDSLVLKESTLGVQMEHASFSSQLSLMNASETKLISDSYKLHHGKQSQVDYRANEQTFQLKNADGQSLGVQFRVSDDGFGFRYLFANKDSIRQVVEKENSSFHFPENTKMFVQPMSVAKTGWQSTNPSYEEAYEQGIPVGTPSPLKAGWVYPALFNTGNRWVLITEAGLRDNYCGSRLVTVPETSILELSFPSDAEVFTDKGALPQSTSEWKSPWRVITIGSLSTIVESTLGTDLADPAIDMDESFVQPGYASWSWAVLKDNSVNYETTLDFIDYAADMNWKYCLIDADWDTRIGVEKVKELVKYGEEKGVGILLWYNSAGEWNTTPYTPKSALLTHEQRKKEFSMLQEMGVKGIKVDFFGGDGQSMIAYYHGIMRDAADYGLLLNFHGATLPRGWHRTYPHLMTVEAIKGFEFITFTQDVADVEANHSAMLPFTRNVFDPMDFTPMVFSEIPNIERKTTNGFELALPTLFHSGIQHMAEIPDGMATVPDYVKEYISEIPIKWDETKFITGYPGKLAVLARRSGETWYITGINGEAVDMSVNLDVSFLEGFTGYIITDGDAHPEFKKEDIALENSYKVDLKPNGGFVMKLTK